ncbi:unnamed protein product, partial [Ostreobium quekettii]
EFSNAAQPGTSSIAEISPEPQPGSVTPWKAVSSNGHSLKKCVMEDYNGSPCTSTDLFDMKVGDIWEGGKQKKRVMALDTLKEIVHKMKGKGDSSSVENAFKTETRDAQGTDIHYRSVNKARSVQEMGDRVAVELEFGGKGENYIFSATPKEWHSFANRHKAEAMFKWAVKHAKSGPNNGELRRDMFLVVEVLVASRVVFIKANTAGRVRITAAQAGGAGGTEVLDRLSELRLAQVGGDLMVRNVTPSVEAHKVVKNSDGACIVRVKNNARWKSSRDFDRPHALQILGF